VIERSKCFRSSGRKQNKEQHMMRLFLYCCWRRLMALKNKKEI